MGKHRNAFQAIEIDLDCITFWKREEKETPIPKTPTEIDTYKTKECKLCATEYAGKYCPHCGLIHGE